MSLLVTGGAGFIGSHLVDRLLQDNNHVVCLDNFNPFYPPEHKFKNIQKFLSDPNFTLVKGDILDRNLLRSLLCDVDYVFHEAAQAGMHFSIENPLNAHENNATGTLFLLEAARQSGVKKLSMHRHPLYMGR